MARNSARPRGTSARSSQTRPAGAGGEHTSRESRPLERPERSRARRSPREVRRAAGAASVRSLRDGNRRVVRTTSRHGASRTPRSDRGRDERAQRHDLGRVHHAKRGGRARRRCSSARDSRAWRCRAARDKLRIVDRAVEEYYSHLAELDAYERDVAEYRRRHAEIEAMEAPRRAARETRIAARRAVADADDDDVVSSVTSEDEPDPFRALGPAPTPPTPRDPMNDPIVAPDGAEGPPLFLLACAAMEGAGDDAVSLAKQLMSIGADPNSRGNRPQHGKNLPDAVSVDRSVGGVLGPAG